MSKSIQISIDGVVYDQWLSAEVSRDMEDFSGSFSASFRDAASSIATFPYGSPPSYYRLRPGPKVTIKVAGQLALVGWLEKVAINLGEHDATVTISGRDVTGDLVDCAALTKGPAEFRKVKLEEAATRIASQFGLSVRSEIDTGEIFERYSLDLAETGFSAIEKGSRARSALILSDGIGGIVITRAGARRAPAGLTLPGNVLRTSGNFSHEGRFSETIVRGQSEKAGKERKKDPALDVKAEPLAPEGRPTGDGEATKREKLGTAATGTAKDGEIKRHRPIVHLARSKADGKSAQEEADWRSSTARGAGDDLTYTVKGHSIGGRLWRVNELVPVADRFAGVNRDMLISNVRFVEDKSGVVTELKVTSPEAFGKGKGGNSRANSAGLDGTAQKL